MIHTKESIQNLLLTNDIAITRAVIAIYKRQTVDEQDVESTKYINGIGFNSVDARYLSWCATYCIRNRKNLDGEHLIKCRKKMMKYWRQLVEIANAKSVAVNM